METNQRDKIVYGVDLLRFASATLVALFHLTFANNQEASSLYRHTGQIFDFDWAESTTSVGRMGVQIFFVISGFVIAYTAQNATPASFLRSRVLRLAPAAWICATLTLTVMLASGLREPGALLVSWFNSVAFIPFGDYIDGVYWTLGVEIAFYTLVFCLVVTGQMQQLDRLFLLVALASAAFCIVIYIVHPSSAWRGDERPYQLLLLVHGAQFAVGVFLWGLLFRGASALRFIGLAVGMVGGAVQTWHFVTVDQVRLLATVLWIASIGAIILSVRFNERFSSWISPAGTVVIRTLGLATYPFYLIHNMVGATIMAELAQIGLGDLGCLAVALVVCFTLSIIVAVKLEPVIGSRLRVLLGGRTRPAAP